MPNVYDLIFSKDQHFLIFSIDFLFFISLTSAVTLFFLVFCLGALSGALFPTYLCNVNLVSQLNYSDISIDLYVVVRNTERDYLPVA